MLTGSPDHHVGCVVAIHTISRIAHCSFDTFDAVATLLRALLHRPCTTERPPANEIMSPGWVLSFAWDFNVPFTSGRAYLAGRAARCHARARSIARAAAAHLPHQRDSQKALVFSGFVVLFNSRCFS